MDGIDDSAVYDALRGVEDPEAGMNVVDLGLVYAVRSDTSGIEVDMTMTTPACPVSEMLVEQARAAVETIAPVGTRVAGQSGGGMPDPATADLEPVDDERRGAGDVLRRWRGFTPPRRTPAD